jgi:hypothetical protein
MSGFCIHNVNNGELCINRQWLTGGDMIPIWCFKTLNNMEVMFWHMEHMFVLILNVF